MPEQIEAISAPSPSPSPSENSPPNVVSIWTGFVQEAIDKVMDLTSKEARFSDATNRRWVLADLAEAEARFQGARDALLDVGVLPSNVPGHEVHTKCIESIIELARTHCERFEKIDHLTRIYKELELKLVGAQEELARANAENQRLLEALNKSATDAQEVADEADRLARFINDNCIFRTTRPGGGSLKDAAVELLAEIRPDLLPVPTEAYR